MRFFLIQAGTKNSGVLINAFFWGLAFLLVVLLPFEASNGQS